MKISLIQEGGIQILSVTGAVVDQNVQVLKAGVTKLLKNGHHRIILELLNPNEVVSSALAGISLLHLLSRQLGGDLVVIFPAASKPKEIELECFSDRISAFSHFKVKLGATVLEPAPVAEALPGVTSGGNLLALVEQQKGTIDELRRQIQLCGGDALGRELAALKEENKTLKQRLEEMLLAFRTPQSNVAYIEKVTLLENEIFRLQEKLSDVPHGAR